MKLGIPLALLLALGLVGACSGDDTTGGTGTGTGSGATTTSSTGTGTTTTGSTTVSGCGSYQYSSVAACQECLEAECCAQLGSCDEGSDCAELADCIKACADQACVGSCTTSHAGGLENAQALWTCVDASCATECEAVVGDGICGTELSYPENESLTQCATDNCCDAFAPCYADADCNACVQDPTGAGCDANDLYGAYRECMDGSCPTLLCDSTLGYASWMLNLCINDACCGSYTPCFDDADCKACMQAPTTTGCSTNTLFTTFVTCRDASCPTLVCTTTIGYLAPGDVDPAFACNSCAGENCCADFDTCDGDGSTAATNLCVACLKDPGSAACNDTTVHDAAVAATNCLTNECPLECPFAG